MVLQKKKTKTGFCLNLDYSGVNIYLLVNGKEIFRFKAGNKNVNFPTKFCLGGISYKFSSFESKEIRLKDFVHDYNAIAFHDILYIYKYLMEKNGIL